VAQFINVDLKRAAVALESTRNYGKAARSLGIPEIELRTKIKTLEDLLCVHLFEPYIEPPTPTEDGLFLIQEMRQLLDRLNQAASYQKREN
jgi:DNA-binding transcriptional LysR family regulator